MANIDEEYPFTTNEDSLKEKDWAAGSREPMETQVCIFDDIDGSARFAKLTFSPQLLKMFDEPIVNVLDHAIKSRAANKPQVKYIEVMLDLASGAAIVMNDGDGVPAVLHQTATAHFGRPTYLPTLIFGTLFQGSNRRDATLPVGGTNGIGVKITNCLSIMLRLTTTCDGQQFVQQWSNYMKEAAAPQITKYGKKGNFTRLDFQPDYERFASITDPATHAVLHQFTNAETISNLNIVLRSRLSMAAAFCKFAIPTMQVKYNGAILNDTLSTIAARLFPQSPLVRCEATCCGFPCEIVAVIAPHKHAHISNVNGIVVADGPHFARVIKQISSHVKTKVAKQLDTNNVKLPKNFVKNNVWLIMNMQMIKPGWSGQRKDTLTIDVKRLSDLIVPDKAMTQIGKHLHDIALGATLVQPTRQKKREPIDYDKYTHATLARANTAAALKCHLIATEGDSAATQAIAGISNCLTPDYYGVICLGGVIINVMKQTTEVTVGDITALRRTDKLEKNKFFKAFVRIVGLNYNYKYDPLSPTYKKEIAELNYGGGIIAMVDQDMDGRGFILPMLMVIFHIFWPNLLKSGFLKWFRSDIIRLFPIRKTDKRTISFMSEADFEQAKPTIDLTKYELKYYKGLATHNEKSIIAMFKTFNNRLATFGTDDETDRVFNIYYGKLPDLRKQVLSRPMAKLTDETVLEQIRTHVISCTHHIQVESHTFQMDNLERKHAHMIDGQNQAGRKIIFCALDYYSHNHNAQARVSQLAGRITEMAAYHHGEASLHKSIATREFIACGGVQISWLSPRSSTGSRIKGGDDAGAPRYVETCINQNVCNLLFHPDTYPFLQYNYEGERQIEPKYYVPPIPLAILESVEMPSNGWKITIWARDALDTIAATRRLINIESATLRIAPLRPARYAGAEYEWTGEFRMIRGIEFSVGRYNRYVLNDGRHLIHITELPLRTWTDDYVTKLRKYEEKYDFIEEIIYRKHTHNIDIRIVMSPDGLNRISGAGDSIYTDDIEEFFKLRQSMKHHINLIGTSNEMREFNTYEQVVIDWFPVAKQMYMWRVERQIILLQIQLRIKTLTLKYINNNYEMRGKRRAEMDTFLANNDFPQCNTPLANNNGFSKQQNKYIATADLNSYIFGTPDTPPHAQKEQSYDYVLNLTDASKSKESNDRRQKEIDEISLQLQQLQDDATKGKFAGAYLWQKELDELETVIKEGHRTSWQFEYRDRYEL